MAPALERVTDFPRSLTPEEWSEFWLGYYQNRRGLKEEGATTLSERMQIVLSPDQKSWVMKNGGSAKIRDLIDAERSGDEA